MNARTFAEIPSVEDMARVRFKVGDRFLTGTKIIAQKELKRVGDVVTYYVVTSVSSNGKNVSYKPVYEKLEE